MITYFCDIFVEEKDKNIVSPTKYPQPQPKPDTAIKDVLFNMIMVEGFLVSNIEDMNSCHLSCSDNYNGRCKGFAFHSKKRMCWLYFDDTYCKKAYVEDGCTVFRLYSCGKINSQYILFSKPHIEMEM